MQERETGSRSGDEWPRGKLAVEPFTPASRHGRGARRAAALRRNAVIEDLVAEARDERLVTRGAAGVFELAHRAGQVPCVDVAEACPAADIRRRREHVG